MTSRKTQVCFYCTCTLCDILEIKSTNFCILQYEEFVYRTEDERFEFDVVLETNKDTIKVLECVQKKMSRMPPEEAARYRLDDCLGGSSPTIHQRAIRRIYGDKAADIIEGLKRNPVVAVPLVLRRLKSKDEEWRDVQKTFNKVWREQNEKYYLKSLDHQGLLFKQSDVRTLRSKSLLNEIETLYDERHEQQEEHGGAAAASDSVALGGPHLTLEYSEDGTILRDANELLIHHVRRQTSIHKEDKQKIKALLKQFLMDLFKRQRQELSDDEREEDDEDDQEEGDSDKDNGTSKGTSRSRKKKEDSKKEAKEGKGGNSSKKDAADASSNAGDENGKEKDDKETITEADVKVEPLPDGRRTPLHARDMEAGESYSHMMCNNNWYLFFRLHNILCERLTKMYNQAVILCNEEAKERKDRRESTAVALRLKPKSKKRRKLFFLPFQLLYLNRLCSISSHFFNTCTEFCCYSSLFYCLPLLHLHLLYLLFLLSFAALSVHIQDYMCLLSALGPGAAGGARGTPPPPPPPSSTATHSFPSLSTSSFPLLTLLT